MLIVFLTTQVLQAWDITGFLFKILSFISPFFTAYAFAWVFKPIPDILQGWGIRKLWSVALTFLFLFLVTYLVFNAFIPVLLDQIISFVDNIPSMFKGIEKWSIDLIKRANELNLDINVDDYTTSIQSYFEELPAVITSGVTGVFSIVTSVSAFIYNIVFILTLGFYIMIDMERFNSLMHRLIPKKQRQEVLEVLVEISISVRGYVNSFSVISVIVFTLCLVGFSIVGLPSAMVLALIIGITNIVPYIGPIVGGIPAIIVALTMGWDKAIIVLIIVVVVQQFDSLVLKPLLMGKQTRLHPLLILLGLLLFGKLWGITGFIIAAPVVSTIKIVLVHLNKRFQFIEE
jgi:predicted PurR-regulated permease PerM